MQLPPFTYHPDPLGTGSVELSEEVCIVCGQARGAIYTGPVYAEEDMDRTICPWCIADGSAHEQYGAEFCDIAGIGVNLAKELPSSVLEEVTYRTPGFSGWQQEQWWAHCEDAALFLGVTGYGELESFGPEAIDAIARETGMPPGKEREEYMRALNREGSPKAYLFQCRHCGRYGGYYDGD